MKRSAQVAVVVMSAASVGGVGYSMMPQQKCAPPANAAPNASSQSCAPSRSSTSYSHGGRALFGSFGSSDSGNSASTTSTTSRTPVGGTQRGGFGSFFASFSSRGG
ncbi:MAG TPA: hypothetical protein VGG01_18220 [Xanthobacteraceae bacterium]|jgi:hypothetical protein